MSADPDELVAGLEPRYHVRKINDPDGKHDDCAFFVLDPKHDPIARVALQVYANTARKHGHVRLADDLEDLLQRTAEEDLAELAQNAEQQIRRMALEQGQLHRGDPLLSDWED